MSSTKNRRLRKKLYLDEFAVLGFEFSCNLNFKTEEKFDSLFDQFIDFIESRELCMGGGGDTKSFGGCICSNHRYLSASNEDRASILALLESKVDISDIVVGDLVDANYGI